MSRPDLTGLPVKPALRSLFLWRWYEQAHGGRLPAGRARTKRLRKKRDAVILRWWGRLPPLRRKFLVARAHAEITGFNAALAANREKTLASLAELREKIANARAGVGV